MLTLPSLFVLAVFAIVDPAHAGKSIPLERLDISAVPSSDESILSMTDPAYNLSTSEIRSGYNHLQAESTHLPGNYGFSTYFNYALINLPFPSSWGFEANFAVTPKFVLGLDYQRSSVPIDLFFFEIGELKESYLFLQSRMYMGSSFNAIVGIGHRTTELRLAGNLFDLALSNYSLTVSELQATMLRFGLGNTWHFKDKYRIAFDWIHLNIPIEVDTRQSAVIYGKDEKSRNDIDRAESIMRWYPSGLMAQIKFGISF